MDWGRMCAVRAWKYAENMRKYIRCRPTNIYLRFRHRCEDAIAEDSVFITLVRELSFHGKKNVTFMF